MHYRQELRPQSKWRSEYSKHEKELPSVPLSRQLPKPPTFDREAEWAQRVGVGTSQSHRDGEAGKRRPVGGRTIYDQYPESLSTSIKAALSKCTAGGCLPFHAADGELFFLVATEAKNGKFKEAWHSDFGGNFNRRWELYRSEPQYTRILKCATRAFAEETYGLLGSRTLWKHAIEEKPKKRPKVKICDFCGASDESGAGFPSIDSSSDFNPSHPPSFSDISSPFSSPNGPKPPMGWGGGIDMAPRVAAFSEAPLSVRDFSCARGAASLENFGWSARDAPFMFRRMECYRQRVKGSALFAEEVILRRGVAPVVNLSSKYALYLVPIPKINEDRLNEASAIVDDGARTFRWLTAEEFNKAGLHVRLRSPHLNRELTRMVSLSKLASFAKKFR